MLSSELLHHPVTEGELSTHEHTNHPLLLSSYSVQYSTFVYLLATNVHSYKLFYAWLEYMNINSHCRCHRNGAPNLDILGPLHVLDVPSSYG